MNEYNVNAKELIEYCMRLFMVNDVPEDEALIIAKHVVDAELYGITSHGISRMGLYLKRLKTGVVNSKYSFNIENETAASISWDGCNSMGMVTGVKVMQRCIDKAHKNGCCFATVKNSNHFGMAGYYANIAAEAGMIGISATNSPPLIAPWGSYQPYIGSNPVAFAAPRKGEPMIFDMASSVVAMGKIFIAAQLGKKIPEGWAITKDGKPTTDPNEALQGSALPVGGPKGYGLALFIDILCGILSGAEFGPYIKDLVNDFTSPQNVGHIFCAIDISKFTDLNIFRNKIEKMISEIKELPKNSNVEEIFMPGELELNRKKYNLKNGITLQDIVYNELIEIGNENGVKINI